MDVNFQQFHHAMIGVYENAREHDYFATIFKRMIDQYGGLVAAKRSLFPETEIAKADRRLEGLGYFK